MNPAQFQQLATLCCVFLVIWEVIRRHFPGAFLSMLALFPLVAVENKVFLVFTILMALPVVFEERWNPRSKKDMIRAVLAAAVAKSLLDTGQRRTTIKVID